MSQPGSSGVPSSNSAQFVTHIPQAQANASQPGVRYVQTSNPQNSVQYQIAPSRPQMTSRMVTYVRAPHSGMARPGQRYPGQSPAENAENNKLMSKNKLQALAKDIDQASILEDDVMELLLKVSEDFIDNVVSGSCALAKHRRSQTLDVQDVRLYLNQQWDLQIPGFPVDDTKHKKLTGEAHKQRLALIRKTLKR